MSLDLDSLTPNDKAEVLKFQSYLRDSSTMNLRQLTDKYGPEYMGWSKEDLEIIYGNVQSWPEWKVRKDVTCRGDAVLEKREESGKSASS